MSDCWLEQGHGTVCGTWNKWVAGCRGPDCVNANNERNRKVRDKRRALSMQHIDDETGGCLYQLGVGNGCGSHGRYVLGCRGETCREAHNIYVRRNWRDNR